MTTDAKVAFSLGWFSMGDLISLGAVVASAAVMWAQLQDARAQLSAQQQAIVSLQGDLARSFVRRDDYREDIREVKRLLEQVNEKLDRKADKP